MKHFVFIAASLISSTGFAITVEWSLSGPDPVNPDNRKLHTCKYPSVFGKRPAKRHSDPPITTLNFKRPPSLPAADHEMCQLIIANRTNLDQQLVRDQIGSLISKFPCPDANVKINTFQGSNPALKIVAPNARTSRVMRTMIIDGCLKERLPECIIPMGGDPQFMMTFEDIKEGITRCERAMTTAVRQGAELASWQDQNDPNKTRSGVPHRER